MIIGKKLGVDLSQAQEIVLSTASDWYLIEKVLIEGVEDNCYAEDVGVEIRANDQVITPGDYRFTITPDLYSVLQTPINQESERAHQGNLTLKVVKPSAQICLADIYVIGTELEKQGVWRRIFG